MAPDVIKGIHHFALSVPNIDDSIRWYSDVLGFSVERTFGFPESGTRIAHVLHPAGIRIELLSRPNSASNPDKDTDAFGAILTQGAKHIGILVADLEAAFAFLDAKGVFILQEPMVVEPAGVRNFWITDNSGNQIEFNQPL